MRIYIDEGGTFQVAAGRDYSFSIVAALVVPASREPSLFYEFMRLRDLWGMSAIEIKGRELGEAHFSEIIDVLNVHDVVLEFLAIDMAWQTERELDEFRQHQARAIVESLTPKHQPMLVAEMNQLSQAICDMPNQLFVQAYLTIELLGRVVQTSTLYYSQRIPEELGRFDWVVDRKDRELTAMEMLWTMLIVPVGQTRAFSEPFIALKEGDYTHFDRFRLALDDTVRDKDVEWLVDNSVFLIRPGEQQKIVNMKKVLKESLRFADSGSELGLQLADIAASACRRAFNGNLQQRGWEGLGRLLVRKDGKPPIIGLALPHQGIDRDRRVHEAPSQVWLTLAAAAKSMWL